MRNLPKKFASYGKASTLFIILILIVLFTVGPKIGKAYFDNASFKNQIEELAERTILEVGFDLPTSLVNTAKEYQIVINPKDVKYKVNDNKDQIKINFDYTRNIDLYAMTYPLSFNIDLTKQLTKEKGIINKFQNDVNDVEGGSRESSQRAYDDIKKKLGQ